MSGDFSTRINRSEHWQAFGVTFALSGVLEMLPLDQRTLAARRLSVAGNPAWMPARDASLFALKRTNVVKPCNLILEQARLGLIAGRAVMAQRFKNRHTSEPVWDEREWDIPNWFWEASLRTRGVFQKPDQNWDLGQFCAEVPASAGSGWIALSGVHFLTESLQVLVPTTEQPPASAPVGEDILREEVPIKSKGGGRPPQPWWDDMWCDLWGLIHQGDFKPKNQADVERAMLTWAEMKGHTLSEATARPKAHKLFKAYESEATNFLAS